MREQTLPLALLVCSSQEFDLLLRAIDEDPRGVNLRVIWVQKVGDAHSQSWGDGQVAVVEGSMMTGWLPCLANERHPRLSIDSDATKTARALFIRLLVLYPHGSENAGLYEVAKNEYAGPANAANMERYGPLPDEPRVRRKGFWALFGL